MTLSGGMRLRVSGRIKVVLHERSRSLAIAIVKQVVENELPWNGCLYLARALDIRVQVHCLNVCIIASRLKPGGEEKRFECLFSDAVHKLEENGTV